MHKLTLTTLLAIGQALVILFLAINLGILNDKCPGPGDNYSDYPSTSVQKSTILSAIVLASIALFGKAGVEVLEKTTDYSPRVEISDTLIAACSITANLLTAVSLGHALTIRDASRCPALENDDVLWFSLASVITIGVSLGLVGGEKILNVKAGVEEDEAADPVSGNPLGVTDLREVVTHHDSSIRF